MKEENPDMVAYGSDERIDELLNSFIDGELTSGQQIEVQRLIKHNGRIAQRLQELQRCKMLLGSLPHADAPADLGERIIASLETRTLLEQQPQRLDEREGARQLLVRRVIAAAAMIGLMAVLSAVIYTIVSPGSGPEGPTAIEDWRRPVQKIEAEKPAQPMIVAAEESTGKTRAAEIEFNGGIELKTDAFTIVAVDAFIKRAIEDNGILRYGSPRLQDRHKSVYAFSCSRAVLKSLLGDLEDIWDRFDSAALFVETEKADDRIVVDAVTTEQIARIVNQNTFEARIRQARDFAALNNMAELLPGKEVLAAIDNQMGDLITIPRPVLTSSERTAKKPADKSDTADMPVHLTIVLVGND